MNKSLALLSILFLITACTPQVTIAPEATLTSTLPPTATQTPEPIATPTAVYTPTPAQEIVTTPRGIELQIGEPIEGQEGAFVITSMNKGEDWATLDGDTRLGFEPEDNQWVFIKGQDRNTRVVLQRVSDNTQIAELKPSGTVAWDWNQLVDSNGESILFRGAVVLEKKDIISSISAQTSMVNTVVNDLPGDKNSFDFTRRIVYSNDGKQAVLVDFLVRGDDPNTGFVFVRGLDGRAVVMYVNNFNLTLPFVTR